MWTHVMWVDTTRPAASLLLRRSGNTPNGKGDRNC
jgi:hypothetical protein